MTRDEMIEKIDITKKEIMFAGPIHRRDLQKHLRRMQKELRDYDRFKMAAKEAG